MSVEARTGGRFALLFAAVSIALVIFAVARTPRLHPERPGDAPMAEYYLSMACRCPWPHSGDAWTIHSVPAPFRWRIVVPWITGLLPFETATSLALNTYVSLAAFYFVMLAWCRRLGLSTWSATAALIGTFAFEPHLINYLHPFLVEGFSLLLIALMAYAFTIDSFALFAITGLCGVFSREIIWILLPIWCARDVKKGVALTAIAAAAMGIERVIIWGPPYARPHTIDPMTVLRFHLDNVSNYVRDVRSTWGWVFAFCALGVALLPAARFRTVAPVALALVVAAVGSSVFATDTQRLFDVMIPLAIVAGAQVMSALAARRQWLLLALLAGLFVLQYTIIPYNGLALPSAHIAAIAKPIRIGTLWTIAAAIVLRRELLQSMAELFRRGAYPEPLDVTS